MELKAQLKHLAYDCEQRVKKVVSSKDRLHTELQTVTVERDSKQDTLNKALAYRKTMAKSTHQLKTRYDVDLDMLQDDYDRLLASEISKAQDEHELLMKQQSSSNKTGIRLIKEDLAASHVSAMNQLKDHHQKASATVVGDFNQIIDQLKQEHSAALRNSESNLIKA